MNNIETAEQLAEIIETTGGAQRRCRRQHRSLPTAEAAGPSPT